jgi:hypothetical protein
MTFSPNNTFLKKWSTAKLVEKKKDKIGECKENDREIGRKNF